MLKSGFAACARERKLTLAAISGDAEIGQVDIENVLMNQTGRSQHFLCMLKDNKDNSSLKNFSIAVV